MEGPGPGNVLLVSSTEELEKQGANSESRSRVRRVRRPDIALPRQSLHFTPIIPPVSGALLTAAGK